MTREELQHEAEKLYAGQILTVKTRIHDNFGVAQERIVKASVSSTHKHGAVLEFPHRNHMGEMTLQRWLMYAEWACAERAGRIPEV